MIESPPTWCAASSTPEREALDLQRPGRLVHDAVPEPSRREREERHEHQRDDGGGDAEADQRVAPAPGPPDVGERGREHHGREDLGRDAEPERGEPEPLSAGEDGGEAGDGERGGPEVVAVEDHRAEDERRERGEGERSGRALHRRAERAQGDGHREQGADAAERHQDLEGAVVEAEARVRECGNDEGREGSWRVLDGEVAVGHVAVHDGVPVAVVLDGVEDQVVLVEAPVEDGERGEEDGDGGIGEPPRLTRRRPALGEDVQRALAPRAFTGSAAGASTAKAANGKNHGR